MRTLISENNFILISTDNNIGYLPVSVVINAAIITTEMQTVQHIHSGPSNEIAGQQVSNIMHKKV